MFTIMTTTTIMTITMTTIVSLRSSAGTMLLAESFSGWHWLLLAFSILTVVVLLFRCLMLSLRSIRGVEGAATMSESARRNTPFQYLDSHLRSTMTDPRPPGPLHDEKLRIKDSLQRKLARLDRLIDDADREIHRLQALLRRSRESNHFDSTWPRPEIITRSQQRSVIGFTQPHALAAVQRQMIGRLHEAGYSVEQIARLIGRPEANVQAALPDDGRRHRRNAA